MLMRFGDFRLTVQTPFPPALEVAAVRVLDDRGELLHVIVSISHSFGRHHSRPPALSAEDHAVGQDFRPPWRLPSRSPARPADSALHREDECRSLRSYGRGHAACTRSV